MKFLLFIVLMVIIPFSSCKEDIMCTEEFALVGVYVTGPEPDRCVSIRERTGDTLEDYSSYFVENWYTIVTDQLKDELRNKQETFTFIGWRNDTLKFKETYIIGADDCHIYKVSGKDTINQ